MTESNRPHRFESPSVRLSDDYADVLDAELSFVDRKESTEISLENLMKDLRYGYDESQALEVLASQAPTLYGEKFYAVREPAFEEDESFIQDFALQRKPVPQEVFWRSIVEDDVVVPPEFPDRLSPDFFLGRKGQPLEKPENLSVVIAGAVLGAMELLKKTP